MLSSTESMTRAIAAALLWAVAGLAQFRSGISIVEVDAQVAAKTRAIDGLGIADFVVRDNRKPVMLRYCAHDDLPLDLILMFELSRFMEPRQKNLLLGAEMAMAELREGDRVAVLSYNDHVSQEFALTGDLKELKRKVRVGLERAVFVRKPVLLPSVLAAAAYLPAQREGERRQRAILMFTGDAGYGLKNQGQGSVSRAFWDADAIVSALVIPTVLTKLTHDDNPFHFNALHMLGFSLFDYVDDVSEQTGGEVVYAGDAGSVKHDANPNAALRRIVERMRKRYKLYYDMPPGHAGHGRRVEVALSTEAALKYPDARVIQRFGYVAR
jgi:hypothetical protein